MQPITWWDVLTVSGIVVLSGGLGFSLGLFAARRVMRKMFTEQLGLTPEDFLKVQEEIER